MEKHPQTQEAVRHLKSIRDNYNHLSKLYKHIDVVPYSEPEANVLRFDFIQGTGLLDGMDFGKLSLDDVRDLLNPPEDAPRAYIRVVDAENLILMDTRYDGIKFKYDEYACHRFRKTLVESLLDFQKNYAVNECLLNCLDDLK